VRAVAALALALVLAPALATAKNAAPRSPAPEATSDPDADATDDDTVAKKLVLLNAANKLGDLGQIDRLKRVLDQRGLLRKLPNRLEAALDGRSVLVHDIDAIKDAYGDADFAGAQKMIDSDMERILRGAGSGDPVPALAELSEWRGMIYAAERDDLSAIEWFRAAYRLNPAWSLEKKYASPSMNALVKKGRREPTDTGKLRIESDPEDAKIRIDNGDPQDASEKQALSVGQHYIVITAPDRAPFADLVEIKANKTEKLVINLDPADQSDRAVTLIDKTITAAPGKARLREGQRLSQNIDGGKRMLVIEDGNEEHVTLRLYDFTSKKVSKPFEFDNNMTSAAITELVNAALDPDNMVSASSVVVIDRTEKPKIYERWYFWAGVAAVAIGGFAAYRYETRAPTAVTF
jgi:hypothetical protein